MALKSKSVPTIFYSATMNDTTGIIYLKIVNTIAKKQTVKINLDGVEKVSPEATIITIKSDKPDDTNTISDPQKDCSCYNNYKRIKKKFPANISALSL